MKLLALFVAASIATGVVVSDAHASLTFTINTLTTDEFSFTLAGTFDADVIGNQTNWLAIKIIGFLNLPTLVDFVHFK